METSYNGMRPVDAIALQQALRNKIQLTPLQQEIKTIGGADISFNKYSDLVYAGIVVLSYPQLEVLHTETAITTVNFPYIPGLLGFREVPALLEVWNKLEQKPDVLVLDGHGIAHPRRMGVASHFGVVAGAPTFGCAKSRLTGTHEILGEAVFSSTSLKDGEEVIGQLLRTKPKCNPVYISAGHLITLPESVEIIMRCVKKYRIPEPTRLAHLLVNEIRIKHGYNI